METAAPVPRAPPPGTIVEQEQLPPQRPTATPPLFTIETFEVDVPELRPTVCPWACSFPANIPAVNPPDAARTS